LRRDFSGSASPSVGPPAHRPPGETQGQAELGEALHGATSDAGSIPAASIGFGHERREVERVLDENDRFMVVEKTVPVDEADPTPAIGCRPRPADG
jgi:hypothetical protein